MGSSASERQGSSPAHQTYEIRVRGEVSDAIVHELGADRRVDHDTALLVDVPDRAALHDVMERFEDLGLQVISINPGDAGND